MESQQLTFKKMLQAAVRENRAELYQAYGISASGRELTDDEIKAAFRAKFGREPDEIYGPRWARLAGPIPAEALDGER